MASKLLPNLRLNKNKYYVELIFRLSVPDKILNWHVFEGDEQILEFLHCEKTFKNAFIDEKEHDKLMNGSEDDANHVLKEMHNDLAGGHYGGETTAHKILRARYYWPTVFRDSHAYAQKCKVCQNAAG